MAKRTGGGPWARNLDADCTGLLEHVEDSVVVVAVAMGTQVAVFAKCTASGTPREVRLRLGWLAWRLTVAQACRSWYLWLV